MGNLFFSDNKKSKFGNLGGNKISKEEGDTIKNFVSMVIDWLVVLTGGKPIGKK